MKPRNWLVEEVLYGLRLKSMVVLPGFMITDRWAHC